MMALFGSWAFLTRLIGWLMGVRAVGIIWIFSVGLKPRNLFEPREIFLSP